ncbi:acetate--CoA ligase family protein [Variovorax sp. WS11]|uniref:acetate--CoA ligase family protein n=1 Tax=Variovorax sp. WS11 TaxID=1105204 RepID=UPI0013D959A7|nr:acetate--CoA ligase family protein [Variovorax sp. WS11]NDZ18844.1 acetate--CoA ligase family protein [Variovorax sp. WS11]
MTTESLDRLFRPKSVAVIGASPVQGNPRNLLLRALMKHGFEGRIYPVTPTHTEVEGLKAYKSVDDLPEIPDVALVITPAKTVPGIIDQCGARNIRNAIVFSAGFEETDEGKDLAIALAEAARKHGVTVIGPNGQGIWSVRAKAMLTYSPAAMNMDHVQFAPIAIISQSGALGGAISTSLHRSGLGCSYMVSVGNETVFDALDALEWIVEQEDVRVVALYIEGLSRADRILRIAERARARDVRVVVLKAGKSELGQQTTASHTGKIASPHAVYSDVLNQAGVIAVGSLGELLSAVEVLAFMPYPRRSSDPLSGLSMLSSSGGAAALLADHSSDSGIRLAQLTKATAARLDVLLPDFARKENPIDLTGQINTVPDMFRNTCQALAEDPRTEALVIQHANSGRRYLQRDGEFYKELARDLPVIVSFVGDSLDVETRRTYREAGVLLSSEPAETMSALSLLYRLREHASLPPSQPRATPPTRALPGDWDSMMSFCRDAGATPAGWVVLAAGEQAAAACARLQYPVVVKALPSDAEHKSELGLVKLRVASPTEVDRVAADFRLRLGKPQAGILVQEMVEEGGVEVVVSCLRNTDFGAIISVGSGGVAVELYRDIAHLALPVTADQVESALRKLKLWTLLQGFRGKPAADVGVLIDAAVRLGDMFLACPDIQELELNPIIVKEKGKGLRVVDALVVGAAPPAENAAVRVEAHLSPRGAAAPHAST